MRACCAMISGLWSLFPLRVINRSACMRMYAIIMIMGNGDYLAYLAFLSDEGMLLAVF